MSGNLFSLAGRVTIVTGASSGIGAGTALALAEQGSDLVLVGRSAERLAATAEAAQAYGVRVATVAVDLLADDAPRQIVDAALAAFGRIDGIVNSAGVFTPAPVEAITPKMLDDHWQTNVVAPFRLTQAAIPHLGRGSAVVFVSSISGHLGSPECVAYCASKGAVEMLVKSMAVELGPRGIRVNAVSPSDIKTPMNTHLFADPAYEQGILAVTPLKRVGAVADVAPAIAFLLSPSSSYVSGSSLLVDGGCAAQ
jgi:glucose 1-dehydrogenase